MALSKTTLFSFYGFGLVDEGESLHNAQRILAGDVPYRDFFAIFPPMDNYFYAIIFRLFGQSIQTPRVVSSFIFAFTPVLVFLICRRFALIKWSIIPAVLLIFLDVNIERLFLFTPIFLGLYLFLLAVDQENPWLFGWAGLMYGLSSLIRIDIPGTFIVASVIILAIRFYVHDRQNWIRKWFIFSVCVGIGVGIPLVTMVIWMIRLNIFTIFIERALISSVTITKLHHLAFPTLPDLIPKVFDPPTLSKTFTAYYGYAILLTYLLSLFLLLKQAVFILKTHIEIPIMLLAGVFSLPYIFGRTDMGHLIKGGTPFLFLIVFLFKNIQTLKFSFIAYSFVLSLFSVFLYQSAWWLRFNDQKIKVGDHVLTLNSKYPINSTKPSAESLKKATAFLQNNSAPTEQVLILPYMAGLYFLADRPSPTQYNNLLAGFITSETEQRAFIYEIESKKVRIVVYDPDNGPKMQTTKMQDYNAIIHEYLMEEFQLVEQTEEGWLFMKRKI